MAMNKQKTNPHRDAQISIEEVLENVKALEATLWGILDEVNILLRDKDMSKSDYYSQLTALGKLITYTENNEMLLALQKAANGGVLHLLEVVPEE